MMHPSRLLPAFVLSALLLSPAQAASPGQDTLLFGRPGWVLPGASADMNFTTGQYFGLSPSQLTVSRASSESEVCNGALTTFPPNVLAITPGCGAWVWEPRTNLFLNNNAPATQTITTVATSYYTISFYGTGTLTLTGACTQVMTGSAFPALTQYSCQAATTALVATVTTLGAMQYPQVEVNPNATSTATSFATGPILTSGAAVTRAATSAVATTPNCPSPSMYTLGATYGLNTSNIEYFAWLGNSVTNNMANSVGLTLKASGDSVVSGVGWGFVGSPSVTAGSQQKIVTSVINGNLSVTVNNSLLGTHNFGSPLVVSQQLYLGQNPYNGNYLNGPLARVALSCGGKPMNGY